MVKKKQDLWHGFGYGALVGAAAVYFLGTKKGRELVRKIVDMAENMENDVEELMNGWEDELREAGSALNTNIEKVSQAIEKKGLLESAMDKISQATGVKKFTKRFFLKDGKLQPQ